MNENEHSVATTREPSRVVLLMRAIVRRNRILLSWLASFVRSEWKPEHYPIEVREQHGVPPEARWCAHVLNWGVAALGATREEARAAMMKKLADFATVRRGEGRTMPRPGTRVPVEFASAIRVRSDPALLEDFITNVLGFKPGEPVFISDISSISDFGDSDRVAEIRWRVEQHYGVYITEAEPVLIADVLDQIREQRGM